MQFDAEANPRVAGQPRFLALGRKHRLRCVQSILLQVRKWLGGRSRHEKNGTTLAIDYLFLPVPADRRSRDSSHSGLEARFSLHRHCCRRARSQTPGPSIVETQPYSVDGPESS